MKRSLRILAWTGGTLAFLVAAVVLAALVLPWNWLRGPLERRAGDAVARSVAIDGPLSVHLGLTTRVEVDDVRIANTPWASRPNMLQIKRFIVSVYLPSLLNGPLVLPDLRLNDADIDLEKNDQGEANWHFANPKAKAVKTVAIPKNRTQVPVIEHIVIDHSRLTYKDPARKIDLDSQVNTALGGDPEHQRVRLAGHGNFEGEQFRLALEGGSILSLRNKSEPYPVRVEAHIGETTGGIDGTVTDPLQLAGFDVEMQLNGEDLGEIFPIFGIPLPHTRPYSLRGRLSRQGDTWTFHDFAGRVGNSDVEGNLSLIPRKPRPKLTATLKSQTIDIKDLSGFLGAKPGHEEQAAPPGRILPNTPFNLDKLRAMDMDIHFDGNRLLAPHLPIDHLKAALSLKDGRAALDPISFAMARGDVAGTIEVDAGQPVPAVKFNLNLGQIKMHDFFEKTPFANEISGTIGGRVDLAGRGDSTAAVLANSNGRLSLFMGGGSFSDLVVRLIGLDISKALGIVVTKDKPVGVRCLVADFAVNQGLAKADTMVLDTVPSTITGQGNVNLADETIDLKLSAHPKQPSLIKARSDIYIRGTFKNPSAGLNPASLAAQGGAAAVLGALLTPLGALLPFIDLGLGKDSPCQQLIQEAKSGTPPAPAAHQRH